MSVYMHVSKSSCVGLSLGAPWLGPGGGSSGGPGDPGFNNTGGSFQALCLDECGCSTSGKIPASAPDPPPCHGPSCKNPGAPACTDENCGGHAAPDGTHHQQGRCVVCSPSFNDREFTVRLWCDPADPACERGFATRAPLKVKILVSDWHRQSSSVVEIGISQSVSSVFCHCLRPTSKKPYRPRPRAAKWCGRTTERASSLPPRT